MHETQDLGDDDNETFFFFNNWYFPWLERTECKRTSESLVVTWEENVVIRNEVDARG